MQDETRRPAGRLADWMDRAAVGASFACLVHCLALPLLIAALPALSRALAIPEGFHLGVLVFAIPVSSFALLSGRTRHRSSWPLLLGTIGLLLLAAGVLAFGGTALETPVTVLGSVALALAHLDNWQLRHACIAP